MVNDECHTGQQYSSRDLISAKYTRSKWNGETPLRLRTRKMCSLFDALVTISLSLNLILLCVKPDYAELLLYMTNCNFATVA